MPLDDASFRAGRERVFLVTPKVFLRFRERVDKTKTKESVKGVMQKRDKSQERKKTHGK
jgi:hypothetical protein